LRQSVSHLELTAMAPAAEVSQQQNPHRLATATARHRLGLRLSELDLELQASSHATRLPPPAALRNGWLNGG
jgi:hypothetical protein